MCSVVIASSRSVPRTGKIWRSSAEILPSTSECLFLLLVHGRKRSLTNSSSVGVPIPMATPSLHHDSWEIVMWTGPMRSIRLPRWRSMMAAGLLTPCVARSRRIR